MEVSKGRSLFKMPLSGFLRHPLSLLCDPFIETHYFPFSSPISLLLSYPPFTTGNLVGADAEPLSSDWPQVTQEKTRRTNEGSLWLVHQSEVMWSGGGLKDSLILVHSITL